MNWTVVVIGLLVFILMAAIASLANIFDILDEVREQGEAIEDIVMVLSERKGG